MPTLPAPITATSAVRTGSLLTGRLSPFRTPLSSFSPYCIIYDGILYNPLLTASETVVLGRPVAPGKPRRRAPSLGGPNRGAVDHLQSPGGSSGSSGPGEC